MTTDDPLKKLPVISVHWPCKGCGAMAAPQFDIDHQTGEVTNCANCEAIKNNIHLESGECWCEPRLAYYNPEDGSEVWIHNMKQ